MSMYVQDASLLFRTGDDLERILRDANNVHVGMSDLSFNTRLS